LTKVENKVSDLEDEITNKADSEEIDNLNNQIESLLKFKLNYEKSAVMQDSYNKRLNALIHGSRR